MITHRTAILIAILASQLVIADVRADGDAADLQQIVVSATRTAQPLDKTGSSMSVLSAADLEQRQTLVVTDILAQTRA